MRNRMRKRKHTAITHLDEENTHEATLPYERLVYAVILQAIRDLKSREVETRLDAALWLVNEAPYWLEYTDLETNPIKWLTSSAKSKEGARYEE